MSNSTTHPGTNSDENGGAIFLTKDGAITLPSFCLLIGVPLLLSGRYIWGILAIVVGLVLATSSAMEEQIELQDKQTIRYNILDAEDLLFELEELCDNRQNKQDSKNNQKEEHNNTESSERIQCLACLSAMAKKCNKKDRPDNVPLLAQQASYITLRLFPNDDEVVTGSISLLALIAKDKQVRQRHKYQADEYGLHIPIEALRNALQRCQEEDDEEREEQLAELQRKGCLFLGAVADGDTELDLAIQIVQQEEGLQTILDAANWFRYHDGVVNWALWSIFILCYDTLPNKVRLIQLNGILTICESLKNIPDSLEVNRHGIAILFDLLRQDQSSTTTAGGNNNKKSHNLPSIDPWEVRKVALAAGLHTVVRNAMMEFSDSMDIMMMGQEMLIGTGYRGDIPQYQQL